MCNLRGGILFSANSHLCPGGPGWGKAHHAMLRRHWHMMRFGFLIICFSGVGCGGCDQPRMADVPASTQNLKVISAAYLEATKQLDRPPQDVNELTPYLKKHGDPAAILRSPDDGQEYVIL